MTVMPSNQQELAAMAGFLHFHAGVQPCPDMRCLGWVSEKKLAMVVAFTGFIGHVAQIHVANAPGWHFTPRKFMSDVFRYGFITAKREMLLGVVNSKNERAMRYDQHLGFREILRLPGMHSEGGDMVLLAMKKSECRYLDAVPAPVEIAAAGSA